jgi:hypothetical protein
MAAFLQASAQIDKVALASAKGFRRCYLQDTHTTIVNPSMAMVNSARG